MLKMTLDKDHPIVYIGDSYGKLGGFDMCVITLADGTTFFPRSWEEGVAIFNSNFGRGATIRFQKEEKTKKTA